MSNKPTRQQVIDAVDLFAGLGGFTEGAEQAGCRVVWAANHWREAVDTHELNHPETKHACQDLHQQDWTQLPPHDLLLASPACTGHTHAKGKERPSHDASRSTAWAVVSAAECHLPEAGVIENVPAFLKWNLYPAWRQALQSLGYSVSPHIIDAAWHGVPQNRKRVFIVLTKSRSPLKLKLPIRDPVPAESFIDFNSGKWATIDRPGRATATLKRIQRGRMAHGKKFLIPYYSSGSGKYGRSLFSPIGTITTRDRWGIVDGDKMRMLSVTEARKAMGFPDDYKMPGSNKLAMHMLGNAVCPPVARDVITALITGA